MKIRHIFIILFALYSAEKVFPQSEFSGTIRNAANNKNVADVMCNITDIGGKKFLGYCITNDDGKYRISINSNLDSVKLHLSSMGYERKSIVLKNHSQQKDILLKEKIFELKEVTVAPPVIWKSGDTLTYNVERLKSKQDFYISDVLKKLPGIEVSDNGNIQYQGRAINKFYIEGLDLLEQRYNIATNSIPADAIASVQVFENHQPIKALKNVTPSESAALNLLLKKSYKMRPVANIEIGAGGAAGGILRLVNAMAMQIRKNRQSLLTFKTNNTGKNLSLELTEHSLSELLNSISSVKELFSSSSSYIPEAIQKHSLFNNSYLFTYNDLFRLDDNSQIRFIGSYLNEKEWRDYGIHNEYYIDSDNNWIIDENGRLTNHDNKMDVNANLTTNSEKFYIDNTLKFSGSWRTSRTSIAGTSPVYQYFYLPIFQLSNKLNLIKKQGKHIYGLSSFINYSNQPQYLKVQSDSLFENFGLLQNTKMKNLYTTNNLAFSRSVRNATYSLDFELNADVNTLKSDMNIKYPESYKKDNYLDYDKYELIFKPGYISKKGPFTAKVYLPFALTALHSDNNNAEGKRDKQYLFINPQMSLTYKINIYWRTLASYSYRNQTGNVFDFADGLRFLNYKYASYGSTLYEKRSSHSYAAGTSYSNQLDALFFYLNVIYRLSKSNLINRNVFVDGFRINRRETIEGDNERGNLIITSSIAKYMDNLKTNMKINCGYNISKYYQYQQNAAHRVTGKAFNIGCRLDSKIGMKNNSALNIVYMGTKAETPTYKSENIGQWKINFAWFFFPSNPLQISADLDYNYNEIPNGKNAKLLLINTAVSYRKKKWELQIAGKNLSNRKIYSIISYDGINTFYSQYSLRGIELLATIRLKI